MKRLLILSAFLSPLLAGGCDDSSVAQPEQQDGPKPTAIAVAAVENSVAPAPPAPRAQVRVIPAIASDIAHDAATPIAPVAVVDLPASNIVEPVMPFPAEVTAFMVDRDGCDHFRGEEPYDAERRAYLEASIRELCIGTDARLARLRQRYASDPDVMAALAQYEDRIEAVARP